jgi:hypothetical protein
VNPGTRIVLTAGLLAALLAAAPEARTDEAKELYQKGAELFEEKRFEEAAEAFRAAYDLKPSWKILFNIGQCEAAAGRYGLALDAFEEYALEGGDDVPVERRDYVADEVRRLQPMVGSIEIEGAPEGTAVVIDDYERAKTPLKGPLRVSSGRHQVMLRKGDEVLLDDTFKVAGGMTTKVELTAPAPEPEPAALPEAEVPPEPETAKADPEPEQPTEPEQPDEGRPLWIGGWVLAGVGAGVLVAGGVTGGLALKTGKDLESDYPDGVPRDKKSEIESMDNLAITTNVLLGVGGALAVTGAIMLILDVGADEEAAVALAPFSDGASAGLVLERRF